MSSKIRDKLAQTKSKLAIPREKLEDHPANVTNHEDGAFYTIDIELITPNPHQPRKYFDPDALNELSESIKQKGVLQPVIIRKGEDGMVHLVAGERRFRAAKMAGLKKIPAIINDGNAAEIALIENLQREDLKPVEEAEALARMIEEHGYTQEKLALVIGKGRTTVTQTLSLNRLPDEIKKECPRADIPKRILVEIAREKDPEKMIALFNQAKDGLINSDQVREITRKRTKKSSRTPATVLIEKAQVLARSLPKLDLVTADEYERNQLKTELENLKNIIDNLLN